MEPLAGWAGPLRPLLGALSGFGNTEVLLPLAAVTLLWLLLRSPRCAASWAMSVLFCVGLTALLKLWFYGCASDPDMYNPSGHTSLSTLVYGAMALVAAGESRGSLRIIVTAGAALFIAAIAASRLWLNAHTAAEIGLGLAIGTVSLAAFGRSYLRSRAVRISPWLLIVPVAALALALHGRRLLDADHLLRQIAGYVRMHCV